MDRTLTIEQLGDMGGMLSMWYLLRANKVGQKAEVQCEARVYAFPRPEGNKICQAVQARLPDATLALPQLDELRVIGKPGSITERADLSVWREVLAEPLLQHACVMLRLTIAGPMLSSIDDDCSTTTFVICGAPANGSVLVKAIWVLRSDESIQELWRVTAWSYDQKFLEAFQMFQERKASSPEAAAKSSWDFFCQATHALFLTHSQERKAGAMVRHLAELPGDRGPAAFVVRVGKPLVFAIILSALAYRFRSSTPMMVLSIICAAVSFLTAMRTVLMKWQQIGRCYSNRRRGLGAMYASQVDFRVTDLSGDQTPTFLKYCSEAESLGGQHVCDFGMTAGDVVVPGNRFFRIGDTAVFVALMRQTKNLLFFPAKPVLMMSTQFADGRRHNTLGDPVYRHEAMPGVTNRCCLNSADIYEMLALHRRRVNKLVAAGAKPLSPPNTPAEVIQYLHQEHELGRKAWWTSPYSYGDAIHEAFKVCRREYLVD
ncbi:MAG: hypothetical protein ACM359_07275 [Bacillota bacterium]